MSLERALAISGWMTEAELFYLATTASRSQQIAEIGSWQGRSTRALADHTCGIVCAVDTWKGSAEEWHIAELKDKPLNWLFNTFCANMSDLSNVLPYQMTSLEAAEHFLTAGTRFDFIFLDASHDYENVAADIRAWQPLLCPDGIFAGHDYNPPTFPGVVQAVHELVPRFRVLEGTALWTTEAA
jgi:SAM-dependent methyltransferase